MAWELDNLTNPFGYKKGAQKPVNNMSGLLDFAMQANQYIPVSGDIQSGILAANDVAQGNYTNAALNAAGLLPFVPSLGAATKNVDSYRGWIPNVRGELTKDKIAKILKNEAAYSNTHGNYPQRIISEFENPEEFAQNIFWHGTGGNVSGGLKPSKAMSLRDVEKIGGGGYGEQYWGSSVSKDKNLASNFTGQSRTGAVYPVILKKGANVKELPNIQDANELDDIIESLWKEKVDAVKIGDWNLPSSEKELVILNPKAAFKYGVPTRFPVFNKQKFENLSEQEMANIYNKSVEQKKLMDEIRKIPTKQERELELSKLEKLFK